MSSAEQEIRDEFGISAIDWDSDDDDVLGDPEIKALLASGTAEERQRRFEQRIKGIYARASELPQLIEQISGTASDTYLEVTVGGAGQLQNLKLRPAARGARAETLNESFRQVYAAATQEAASALTGVVSDFQADADPGSEIDALSNLFDQVLHRAEADLATDRDGS